jgi:hypothetical protein
MKTELNHLNTFGWNMTDDDICPKNHLLQKVIVFKPQQIIIEPISWLRNTFFSTELEKWQKNVKI